MLDIYSSKVYRNAPIWVQNLILSLKGLVYWTLREQRPKFKENYNELNRTQWLDREKLEEMQNKKLSKIIHHAYQTVPYYKRVMDERGIKPTDVTNVRQLKKLPLITKEEVRKNPEEFLSNAYRKSFLMKTKTSGTTGTPLQLYRDMNAYLRERAFVWRQFNWAGTHLGDKIVALRGDLIVPIQQQKLPYWRYDIFQNQLVMSSYHLSHDSIPFYLKMIDDFKPKLIYAYPSSIYLLARWIYENRTFPDFSSLKGIVVSSETLFPYQKEVIEAAFKCKVFDWYGLGEWMIFISTCEEGMLHINPEYGITEFIPLGQDNQFELVGTGFNNWVMPLIRYKTGDVVILADKTCPCGRNFPIVKSIEGRMGDYIKTPDGRTIGEVCLYLSFRNFRNIIEAQIHQTAINSIFLKIVPTKNFSKKEKEIILRNLKDRIGPDIEFKIFTVNHIPRTKSGKFRAVISDL